MQKRRKYKPSSENTESKLEKAFLQEWLKYYPNDMPALQFTFHRTRLWRFDFCWKDVKIAVEIQGYGPGHCSREGMFNDAEKNNAAIAYGYQTLYFTSRHLNVENIKSTIKFVAYILSMKRFKNANRNPRR